MKKGQLFKIRHLYSLYSREIEWGIMGGIKQIAFVPFKADYSKNSPISSQRTPRESINVN